jgi:hypothetical protein
MLGGFNHQGRKKLCREAELNCRLLGAGPQRGILTTILSRRPNLACFQADLTKRPRFARARKGDCCAAGIASLSVEAVVTVLTDGGAGAMVARATPDRKVIRSSRVSLSF